MITRVTPRLVLLVAFETILIVLAVGLAMYVLLDWTNWQYQIEQHAIAKALLLAVVTQACLYYADLYDLRIATDRRELVIRVLQALGAAAIVLASIFFLFPASNFGRGVFLLVTPLVMGLVIGWRVLFDWAGRRMGPRERVLLVGTSPAAVALARELHERRHELGVSIVGFVDPDPAKVGQALVNPGVIGTVAEIPAIVVRERVDRVVVSLADARGKLPMDSLLSMRLERGVAFAHLATVYEEYTGKIAIENLRPSWLIFSEGFSKTWSLLAAKRIMDVVFATIGLVLALPLMALTALAIRLTSPGPVLYHQKRVGQDNKTFTVHKFRSMRVDAEKQTGAVWATSNDSRVTPVGRFIRRTRLDEIPQLWNVLTGDMSLVGPRPERPEFVSELTEKIPFYGLRHSVRPGVTGWAQVRYTYGASVEDAMQKLQYDLYYIKHVTVALDLYILFSTVKTVILRKGAQ